MTAEEPVRAEWECGECNRKEGPKNRIRSVCHHCGKPLCDDDRVQIDDDVYSPLVSPAGSTANHCSECKNRHHSRALRTGRAAP